MLDVFTISVLFGLYVFTAWLVTKIPNNRQYFIYAIFSFILMLFIWAIFVFWGINKHTANSKMKLITIIAVFVIGVILLTTILYILYQWKFVLERYRPAVELLKTLDQNSSAYDKQSIICRSLSKEIKTWKNLYFIFHMLTLVFMIASNSITTWINSKIAKKEATIQERNSNDINT